MMVHITHHYYCNIGLFLTTRWNPQNEAQVFCSSWNSWMTFCINLVIVEAISTPFGYSPLFSSFTFTMWNQTYTYKLSLITILFIIYLVLQNLTLTTNSETSFFRALNYNQVAYLRYIWINIKFQCKKALIFWKIPTVLVLPVAGMCRNSKTMDDGFRLLVIWRVPYSCIYKCWVKFKLDMIT